MVRGLCIIIIGGTIFTVHNGSDKITNHGTVLLIVFVISILSLSSLFRSLCMLEMEDFLYLSVKALFAVNLCPLLCTS